MGAIRYALLGLLLEGSSYPYELTQRFKSRIGPGWELDNSSVSQLIRRLEQEGLVERVKPNHGVPGNNESWTYRITERGRAVYLRWMSTSKDERPEPVRDKLYVKVALCGPANAPYVLADIDRRVQVRTDQLAAHQEEMERRGGRDSRRLDQRTSMLPLKAVIERIQSELEWLVGARKDIEELIDE